MNGSPALAEASQDRRWCRWFDETGKCLTEMASNPLPRLLSFPNFNPWFTLFGVYKCCDPVDSNPQTSGITLSKKRLKSVADDLDVCASLTGRLIAKISKLEKSTINTRLLPDLRARANREYSQITIESLRLVSASLSPWRQRFAQNATLLSEMASKKVPKPNADLVIPLLCHLRLVAGKEAPGLLARLLEAGFTGHGDQHKAVSSAGLINLEKRYKTRNRAMYLDRQALAALNTLPLPDRERALWQRGTKSDLETLKKAFRNRHPIHPGPL